MENRKSIKGDFMEDIHSPAHLSLSESSVWSLTQLFYKVCQSLLCPMHGFRHQASRTRQGFCCHGAHNAPLFLSEGCLPPMLSCDSPGCLSDPESPPKPNPVFSPSYTLELGRDADSHSGVSWIHPSDLSHRTKLHLKKVHGLWSQRDKSSKPNSDFCPSSVAIRKIILLLWASVSPSVKWEGNTSNNVGFRHFSHAYLCFLLMLFPCLWCLLFHWHKLFRLLKFCFFHEVSDFSSPWCFFCSSCSYSK